MKIQLSDHFTYGKLFRFTFPSIIMMIFTSIYSVVDGFFVSNFAGKTAFASINLVMPFIIFIRPNSSKLHLTKAKFKLRPILQACANGSSELMSNISGSVVGIVYNFQLLKYLGENGVSAYGVLMYVQFIFIAIFVGYSIGCAPVVSFHYGAGNHSELQSLLKKSTRIVGSLSIILTVLALALAHPLAKMFVGYDAELLAITSHAFKLFSFSFLLAGFNIFASSFFTALNNGAVSAAISFLRTLIFQTSSVLILPLILGVDGLWGANVAAEIFAFVISLVFLVANRKRYHY